MKFIGKLTAAALVVGSTLLLSSAANAQNLLPAPSLGVPVPNVAFFGGVQVGQLSSDFNLTVGLQTITGTVLSAVYSGGAVQANLFGPGQSAGGANLDFYYQIVITGGNNAALSTSFASFANILAAVAEDVASDIDGPAGNPGFASSAAPEAAGANRTGGTGVGISFDFADGGVQVGGRSTTLIVRTNATTFDTGNATVFGAAGISGNALALAPAAPVVNVAPEPASLALIGMTLLGGVAVRRRKKA